VVLVSETRELALHGALYAALARRIDGHRTATDIAEAMAGEATPDEVGQALAILRDAGYVVEAPDSGDMLPAFWSALGFDPPSAQERLRATRVMLHADDPVARAAIAEALRGIGAAVLDPHTDYGGDSALDVAVVPDLLESRCGEHDRRARAQKRPWLPVKIAGRRATLGPFFVPGRTACWHCLAQRLRFNRQIEVRLAKQPGVERLAAPPSLCAAAPAATLSGLVALGVARFAVTGRDDVLEGRLLEIDLHSGEQTAHAVVRRPQCEACGVPSAFAGDPLAYDDERLALRDGGYRAVAPAETARRMMHHVSRVTGVVSVLRDDVGRDDGVVHVYTSGLNLAQSRGVGERWRGGFRTETAGKGTTAAQAKVGALCEALERYSGAHDGSEPRILARLSELGDAGIHPNACMLFSDAQYTNRIDWNRAHKSVHRVPHRFDPEARVARSPCWSLTRGEVRYLPTAYCYFGYDEPSGRSVCLSDSERERGGQYAQ
jgi:bacteriocin biosynthesis cyclodehydratase domain-containing protein